MINPLNHHYSFENPASIYDEEAMTALELAGRTTKKVNECVEAINGLAVDMETNHKELVESVPGIVANDVQKHIENGDFDKQINKHLDNMDERLDNLILNGSENTAEVVDIRSGAQGFQYDTAGDAVRGQTEQAMLCGSGLYKLYRGSINAEDGKFYYPVTNRVVSSLIAVNQLVYIKEIDSANIRLFYYGSQLEYLGFSGWENLHVMERVPDNVHYIRFVVARTDDADFVPDDVYQMITVCNLDELERAKVKKVSDIPFIRGSVNGSGKIVYYDNRLVSPMMKRNGFVLAVPKMETDGSYFVMFACYDANMNWLYNTQFTYDPVTSSDLGDAEYIRAVIRYTENVELTEDKAHRVTLYTSDTEMMDEWNKNAPPFLYEMLDIAYSEVHMGPINTADHFKNASHMGFNALKGDVQITSDNRLIMSHDAGVTFDTDNFIGSFDSNSYSPWVNMTGDEVNTLLYSETDALGDNCKVCSFREYLRICVDRHKIAYITLRDVKIPELVRAVFNILREYNMENRCVINSYTLQTLEVVRTYSRTIPVSLVLEHEALATMNDVTRVRALGNGILTLFYFPGDGVSMLNANDTVLTYANKGGVVLHMAQVNSIYNYLEASYRKITGFHLTKCVLNYSPKNYGLKVNVSGSTVKVSTFSEHIPVVHVSGAVGVPNTDNDVFIIFENAELVRYLKTLPATVTVHSFANKTASGFIDVEGGQLHLVHGGVDGEYLVTITV